MIFISLWCIILSMRELSITKVISSVKELALKACFSLCDGVTERLISAKEKESGAAEFALKTLIDNAELSKREQIPICQDTGMAVVFAEIGQDVHFTGGLFTEAVNEGVRQAYGEYRLRKSVLDPITRKNTGDNTPAIIHTELVKGDKVKLWFMPKGFGSENMSKLYMLTPAAGIDGVKDKVVEAVKSAGSNPCPPIVVGVGIGGTADYAMLLAKKALLRDMGSRSNDETLAGLELELLDRINALGIGAQGFGGNVTALDVRIEKFPTHIAALPVGVSIQCNAHRLSSTEVL